MSRHGVEAAESKLIGNFLKGRGGTLRPLPFLNEIENLLLSSGQSVHAVYLNSIMRMLAVKHENAA